MSFQLKTLFYMFALIAAGLAAFGVWGVVVAGIVLNAWRRHGIASRQMPRWADRVMAFVLTLLAAMWINIYLLHPCVVSPRGWASASSCANNMKQLSVAILNYESAQEQWPLTAFRRGARDDLHSWRVDVLPQLEPNWISGKYSFDEPFDGPNNSKLQHHDLFSCPAHDSPGRTVYFAVTGPQTAWGDGEPRSAADIRDGPQNTILLIETTSLDVRWSEPRDLTFDEAVDLLSSPISPVGSDGHLAESASEFTRAVPYRQVAICDGSVWRIPSPIARDHAIALLTADGGETLPETLPYTHITAEWDSTKLYPHIAFAVLAVFPAFVRRREPAGIDGPSDSTCPGENLGESAQ